MEIQEVATILGVHRSTVVKWVILGTRPTGLQREALISKLPKISNLLNNRPELNDTIGDYKITKIFSPNAIELSCLCGKTRVVRLLDLLDLDTCYHNKRSDNSIHHIEDLKKKWKHMIRRCSPQASDIERKAYYDSGVRVANIWQGKEGMNNFIEWALENGYKPGLELDKDFYGNGLIYSPESCTFVPRSINCTSRKQQSENTSKYTGVSRSGKNWFAQVVYTGSRIFGKNFKTEEQAALARDKFIIENNLPHKRNIL